MLVFLINIVKIDNNNYFDYTLGNALSKTIMVIVEISLFNDKCSYVWIQIIIIRHIFLKQNSSLLNFTLLWNKIKDVQKIKKLNRTNSNQAFFQALWFGSIRNWITKTGQFDCRFLVYETDKKQIELTSTLVVFILVQCI